MRRLLGCTIGYAVLGMTAQGSAALPTPQTEWTVDLKAPCSASPVPYPSDKPNSVIIASDGRVTRIDGRGKVVFDRTFGPDAGRGGIYDASLADLDGDGVEELIVGHNAGFVYGMEADDGKILWEYNLGTALSTWRFATPVDLDGDGRPEIVAPNMDGWIACLSHDGKLRWRAKIEAYRLSTPSVGDINHDGRPEIVYGSATRHLIALDADGRLLWDRFQPPLHLGRTAPIIADLDHDGNAEIYCTASNIAPDTGLVSVNGADGTLRWVGATLHKAYMGRSVMQFPDGSRGILACDKSNTLSAFGADGKLRWRTEVDGRGIWTAPAVADVDGDGAPEIVVTVRDTAREKPRNSWYVLDPAGKVLGGYPLDGGGFGGACIADFDGDGVLEIVIVSRSGKAAAYCFGGAARPEAIVSSFWRGPAYPLRVPGKGPRPAPAVPEIKLLSSLPKARFGNNALALTLPPQDRRLGVEVTTTAPDGVRNIRVFHAAKKSSVLAAQWPVFLPGSYRVTLRLLDLDRNRVLGTQSLRSEIADVIAELAAKTKGTIGEVGQKRKLLRGSAPQATITLARREAEVAAVFAALRDRIASAAVLEPTARDALAAETDAYLAYLEQTRGFAALVASEAGAGRQPAFVCWRDDNPWDNVDPLDSLPEHGGPLNIDHWAFGNEVESVCVHFLNLALRGLTLRVEPGTVTREGETKALGPARTFVRLHRVVRLPSRFNEVVPDLLPPLGDGFLLDVAPGEVQSLWMNIRTQDLDPGVYELKWPIRTLDAASATVELTIRLEVSPVRLPDKSRFAANFWSRNRIGDFSTVADLNEHGQNVWDQVPLPAARADATGEIVGTIDWSAHDAILTEARQIEKIFYGGVPTPTFPKGVKVTDELRLKGRRSYVKALVAHLSEFGLGYEDFMFYPEDEPGLTGSIAGYMRRARANKAIDPRLQNYANPWGAITVEKIREMWPVTDVWQPGMDTLAMLGKPYVDAMRAGGKPIWTYTPPGNCRVLRPLGFFRAQAWLAFHWGIEGGGWWVYYGDDLWATRPEREPGYGGVAFDGRALVTSRRWEANRDGIEDFNMLCLLRDWAEGRNDAEAAKLLEAAVTDVAQTAYTGMPREAADYDLDFRTFQEQRTRIRETLERLQR